MKKGILILLISFSVFSCVEEYWPDVLPKYDNALVVDGEITSLPGPYIIRLSLSSNVGNPSFRPFGDCEVIILEEDGEREVLVEESEGVYTTTEGGIQGQAGNSYKMKITTKKGVIYESDFVKMASPTIIDTITTEIEYQAHPDYNRDMQGYRFYVNTQSSDSLINYYLWVLRPTYKFNANYRIKYYFDGQMHRFPNPDSLYTCYKTFREQDIFILNTSNLNSSEILKFPLNYVTTETKELSIRYSLLVNQYSISEDAFQFWENIRSLNDEQGSLHSRLPFQIKGNVYNLEDPNEPVLGYFTVGGVSTRRLYIDRPLGLKWYYEDSCNLYAVDNEILWTKRFQWPLFLPGVIGGSSEGPAWVDYQWCVDCTKLAGDLAKPEFWED